MLNRHSFCQELTSNWCQCWRIKACKTSTSAELLQHPAQNSRKSADQQQRSWLLALYSIGLSIVHVHIGYIENQNQTENREPRTENPGTGSHKFSNIIFQYSKLLVVLFYFHYSHKLLLVSYLSCRSLFLNWRKQHYSRVRTTICLRIIPFEVGLSIQACARVR